MATNESTDRTDETPTPANPLVGSNAAETINSVASVLDFLRFHPREQGSEPTAEMADRLGLGEELLYQAMSEALQHAAGTLDA